MQQAVLPLLRLHTEIGTSSAVLLMNRMRFDAVQFCKLICRQRKISGIGPSIKLGLLIFLLVKFVHDDLPVIFNDCEDLLQ